MALKHALDLAGIEDDILRLYFSTMSYRLKKMGAAGLKSADAVQKLAHNMCGASAFLGFEAMAELLRQLERAAARGASKKTSRLIDSVHAEFHYLRRQSALRLTS